MSRPKNQSIITILVTIYGTTIFEIGSKLEAT